MKQHLIYAFALAAAVAANPVSAEKIRKDLASSDITPCTKVEVKQVYNATTRQARQTSTIFAIVEVPNTRDFKVAAEQCLVAATAAAGTAALIASPVGAFATFKAAFDICAKAKSAELLAAKVTLDIESKCHWAKGDPVATKDPRTDHPVFDLGLYIALQDDVRDTLRSDLIKSESHWLANGLREGRRGSLVFDPRYYLETHADLVSAFGVGNYPEAANHWIAYGLNEGRRSSLEFDVKFYLSNNDDLRKAFGPTGYAGAAQHWAQFGVNEGRQGSRDFDVRKYLGRYEDLRKIYGASNFRAAYEHWLHYGKNEKRIGI